MKDLRHGEGLSNVSTVVPEIVDGHAGANDEDAFVSQSLQSLT